MATLIVTEKPKVAERIARSIGSPQKLMRGRVPYFKVGDVYVAPAVGHVYGLREKDGGGSWTYPVFDIEWAPNYEVDKSADYTKKYLDNIRMLARECDRFINSCDYDVEGEVIGYNVIRFACNIDPLGENVRRMKYSTLTDASIKKAYGSLEKIHKGMADAGLARHILDWYWGINLSRALSLSVRKAGRYVTLSIGRVQGPTLKILAKKEREVRAFEPQPYWQVELHLSKDGVKFTALHEKDKFWEKSEAEDVKKKCGRQARVLEIKKREIKQNPPAPFDLTTLQTEAYKHLKIDPRRTMEIAQDLYTSALISYPRTSSQEIPPDIGVREIMEKLGRVGAYQSLCRQLLSKEKLKPANGKKKDPAHPAIHPTGESAGGLPEQHKKIYDLVVRRFLATFGEVAVRESIDVRFDDNGEFFVSKGVTTKKPGWHVFYGPYARFEETELPMLSEGEVLPVEKIMLHEKETKPPKRYTPASIIREMEKKNIGTKATRSQIVDILFRRNYVKGKTIEVTELGLRVVDTPDKYCPQVLSEKLTRKFEGEMEAIEAGKITKEKVLEEGKNTLIRITEEFKKNDGGIGRALVAGGTSSRKVESLGKCLRCEGELVLRKSSQYKGFFVGCTNYPDCTFKISLPDGDLKRSGKCGHCGYAMLRVSGRSQWRFCINPECPSKKKFRWD